MLKNSSVSNPTNKEKSFVDGVPLDKLDEEMKGLGKNGTNIEITQDQEIEMEKRLIQEEI